MMKAHLALFLAPLLLCTGAALAQTPDPCGNETGAAYGLCNAYVAAECQTTTPSASEVACSRIAAKFLQITGRDLASKFVNCPCVGIAGFDNIVANFGYCSDEGDRFFVSIDPFSQELTDTAFANFEDNTCGYSASEPPSSEILSITQEQATACVDLLRATAADRGVTCQGPAL
jgi:hypothetical protein